MDYKEFEQLIDDCEQAKQDYLELASVGTFRQDDEYTMKAIGSYNKYNALREQVEQEIVLSDDENIKNYFSNENDIKIS